MENQKDWFEALRPKKSSDFFAFVVMIVLLWVIMLFELLIVLPIYHAPLSGWYCIHVFCGFFLWMNVFANFYTMIFRGQTSYERKKHKREYDLGWKQNFLQVLGARWYLVWIWPTITSPLEGDGTNFRKAYPEQQKCL